MSANSIEKEARDNYYVQTVHMDTAHTPAPQMAPYQRTYGNPVRDVYRADIFAWFSNDCSRRHLRACFLTERLFCARRS